MRERRREAAGHVFVLASRSPRVQPTRDQYLWKRGIASPAFRTSSDSRSAGMLRFDIKPRLTRVAGFPTLSERLLRPYATRAQAEYERFCCPRPARFTGALR
jgi:hypothetical protein